MSALAGQCLCGACRFTATVQDSALVCHCGKCRKWTGGMYIAAPAVGPVEFDDGAPIGVFRSSEQGERVFCRECGSSILSRSPCRKYNNISIQCFEDPSLFSVETEIFIEDKPACYSLAGSRRTMTGDEVRAMFAAQQEG